MALYYVKAFDTVVHGPFNSDEEMMSYHYSNFESGDLLSIHESNESAEKEANHNLKCLQDEASQLLETDPAYSK
jgi:hypothetical protein